MRFRDWVTALAGLAAVAVSIFAIGGVLRWTQAIVALLVAVSLAGVLVSGRRLARISPLVALPATALGLTVLQLIPLPSGLLAVISPVSSALRDDGAALLETTPWHGATNDAPATLGQLVFFLTLLGLAIVALRLSTTERGRYRVLATVGALCGVTAVVTGIHKLFGIHALYGIYEPEHAQPQLMAPLLNNNSLACLMAAGAMLGVGLAAHRRQPGWIRAAWLLVVLACAAVTVTTISRGATLALIAGGLVTTCLIIVQRVAGEDASRKRRARFITSGLPVGIVAGCMVILVIYFNAGNVERQLNQLSVDELSTSGSKFVAWRSAADLVEDNLWAGVGRGAFETAFTRVHPASGLQTYSYAENEYLQAIVDFGIPGALALAAIAVWLAAVAMRRWRDGSLAAGAIGALTVVAAQSNVDFGLEFLGLAAPATAIAATLTYVPLRDAGSVPRARIVRALHIAALVAGAVLLFSSLTTTVAEDHRTLQTHATLSAARASAERHPLDYYAYATAADLLDRAGDGRAIRLLNHALLLHPTHPGLHRMAARMLYREKFVAQAAVEYAAALRFSSAPAPLLTEILGRFPVEQAAAALPADPARAGSLVRMLTEQGRNDVATLYLDRVLAQNPRESRACEQLYQIAQAGSIDAAKAAGRRCATMLPDYQTRVSLTQMLAQHHEQQLILDLLADVESWQTRVDDKINAWLAVCDAHRELGHIDDAKRCLRRLDASPDMRAERRNEIVTRLDALQKAADPLATPATGSGSASP